MKQLQLQFKNFISAEAGYVNEINENAIILSFEDERSFAIDLEQARDLICKILQNLAYFGDEKAQEIGKTYFEEEITPQQLAMIDQANAIRKESRKKHTCMKCGKRISNGNGYGLYENLLGYQCVRCYKKPS